MHYGNDPPSVCGEGGVIDCFIANHSTSDKSTKHEIFGNKGTVIVEVLKNGNGQERGIAVRTAPYKNTDEPQGMYSDLHRVAHGAEHSADPCCN